MPNDNQPAKSYIETVMARADVATKELVLDPSCQRRGGKTASLAITEGCLKSSTPMGHVSQRPFDEL